MSTKPQGTNSAGRIVTADDGSSLGSLNGSSITTGDIARARMTVGLAAGGDPVSGTVVTATTRVETPTVGTSSVTQHALPPGTADVLTADSTATVTGKSIDAGQLTGDVVLARIATSLAAGGGAVKGTVVTASTRVDAPSIGTDSSNQHAPGTGTGALLDANSSLPAANLTGSVADARLSANVDLLNTAQTFTARKTFPSAGSNAALIPAILGGGTSTNGHIVPNIADDTFALLAAAQTLTNKTLTSPVIGGTITGTYAIAGTVTFPAAVVQTTSSQTLTNKTLTAPILSGSVTGTYTMAGTPTITSPAISSPTFSGTLAGTYTIGGTPTFPASVLLTSGAQTVTAQKTFPAAGANAVVIPAVRQTSAGNDITVPVASGSDSFALLAQTQTLTNKTLTAPVLSGSITGIYTLAGTPTIASPTISSPTLSGAVLGTYALSATCGINGLFAADISAFGHKLTNLGSPTPGSSDAATAAYVDTKAASIVTVGVFGDGINNRSWTANSYLGLSNTTSGSSGSGFPGPAQWVAPCSGTIKLFRFFSGSATSVSTITFTVYQTSNVTTTTLTLTPGLWTVGDNGLALSCVAGDSICIKTDTTFATGAPGGFSFTAVFIPAL